MLRHPLPLPAHPLLFDKSQTKVLEIVQYYYFHCPHSVNFELRIEFWVSSQPGSHSLTGCGFRIPSCCNSQGSHSLTGCGFRIPSCCNSQGSHSLTGCGFRIPSCSNSQARDDYQPLFVLHFGLISKEILMFCCFALPASLHQWPQARR